MMPPPKSYAAAQEELEAILEELQRPDSPLDVLTQRVRRAKDLIAWSRKSLRETETEVNGLLEDVDA